MQKLTIKDTNVDNKRVLVRVDFNVPVNQEGVVQDDFRIRSAVPTIRYLLDRGCSVSLIAHLGRPTPGKLEPNQSLRRIAQDLAELLQEKVDFRTDIDDETPSEQRVVLYENLRNWPGEAANSDEFAARLAQLGDVFVQDAFGVAHRKVASTDAVTQYLDAYAGLLLEREVDILTNAMENPAKPLVAIVGGAKIADKIDFIDELVAIADGIVIGGAMANTFLQNDSFGGFDIGASVFEEGEEATLAAISKNLADKKTELVLPDKDVAVGMSINDSDRREVSTDMVGEHDMILDVGTQSLEAAKRMLSTAKTVIWNGPLGYIENPAYATGSIRLAHYLSELESTVIIGGGDTAEFINEAGLHDKFTHVSTGGGASLELMSGKKLPAVEALLDAAKSNKQ